MLIESNEIFYFFFRLMTNESFGFSTVVIHKEMYFLYENVDVYVFLHEVFLPFGISGTNE